MKVTSKLTSVLDKVSVNTQTETNTLEFGAITRNMAEGSFKKGTATHMKVNGIMTSLAAPEFIEL